MMAKFDAPTRITEPKNFVIPVVIKAHLFPKLHVITKVPGHFCSLSISIWCIHCSSHARVFLTENEFRSVRDSFGDIPAASVPTIKMMKNFARELISSPGPEKIGRD